MKIAITAQQNDSDSDVDSRFGRAAYFCIVDTETKDMEFIDNDQNLNAAQGAGIQSAQIVAKAGVECILTGHCGPKAFTALKASGVKIIVGVEGKISEVIEKFKNGEYSEIDSPDVDGHWV